MELWVKSSFKSWYIIIIYTKVNKEIILNRDLCGVFRELKAKKTYNYWSVEENKWKMVFRSTTDDGESRWSAEHLEGILFYTSTNFCWCREPLICRTLLFGTLIFVRSYNNCTSCLYGAVRYVMILRRARSIGTNLII